MAGMAGKARRAVEWGLDAIFPKSRVCINAAMRARLAADPICVIDVGGAMGLDPRWAPLRPTLARSMTFEPDSRSAGDVKAAASAWDIALPVALADRAGERTLFLTQGPFASSLYQPDEAVLRDFCTWPWYEPVGEARVAVDTLDACLARHPDWRADFIKVDAEGADLDVLKGASESIEDAFGVQVEVAVVPRNVDAPVQPMLDLWLREAGFVPFHFIREHWVRTNGVYGATSRPQLIWADAVYFRPRDWVMQRLREVADADGAAATLTRFTAILLVYQAHDYAADLVAAASRSGLVKQAVTEDLAAAIERSVMALAPYVLRGAFALAAAAILAAPLVLLGARGRTVARNLGHRPSRTIVRRAGARGAARRSRPRHHSGCLTTRRSCARLPASACSWSKRLSRSLLGIGTSMSARSPS